MNCELLRMEFAQSLNALVLFIAKRATAVMTGFGEILKKKVIRNTTT